MDENKNQNQDIGPEADNNNSYPSWMGDDNDDQENDESLGHESLAEDQDVDIDEYEETDNNPVLEYEDDNDEEGEYVKNDDQEEGENEGEGEYEKEDETGFYDDNESDEEEEDEDDNVVMPKSKILLIKKILGNIKENTNRLNSLIGDYISEEDEDRISISEASEGFVGQPGEEDVSKIVEGVFDGESMIGPDGKQYNVPPNYASKSKLVEGDILKLTITKRGTFVYKQIKPIERERVIGTLEKGPDAIYYVQSENRRWRILTASVTYFKGEPGDEAVILVPKVGETKWAAVENIIRSK